MVELLALCAARKILWGVVTNKPARYTDPLMAQLQTKLGLAPAACIVSGDTAARPKPAPDPLLLAASQIGIAPGLCLYVGDDLRDIQAGQAAGMPTAAAAWGYLGDSLPLAQWGADIIVQTPDELGSHLFPA